jgi:hypothetical protein
MSTKPNGKEVATRKLDLPVWAVLCLAFGMHLGLALNTYAGDASALDPIWSKNAVRLHVECDLGAKPPASASRQQIPSPNRLVTAVVTCGHSEADDGVQVVRVISPDQPERQTVLRHPANESWRPQELLWSPDSKAFFVNGSENAYSGDGVLVFELDSPGLHGVDPAKAAQRDMVRRFPPCQARDNEADVCARVLKNPDFNMSAITWTRESHAIIVIAEVPCSSSYGGIMCQVQGYELDAHTGKILARMSAKDLKERWQGQMSYPMRIPEPPEFGLP